MCLRKKIFAISGKGSNTFFLSYFFYLFLFHFSSPPPKANKQTKLSIFILFFLPTFGMGNICNIHPVFITVFGPFQSTSGFDLDCKQQCLFNFCIARNIFTLFLWLRRPVAQLDCGLYFHTCVQHPPPHTHMVLFYYNLYNKHTIRSVYLLSQIISMRKKAWSWKDQIFLIC